MSNYIRFFTATIVSWKPLLENDHYKSSIKFDLLDTSSQKLNSYKADINVTDREYHFWKKKSYSQR